MKIADFIGEATEYDKKLTLEEKKPKSWLKSVSAFANGKGGVLFFGVADDDALIGLIDARSISEKISEIIKTKMDPVPQINMEIHVESGREFIAVSYTHLDVYKRQDLITSPTGRTARYSAPPACIFITTIIRLSDPSASIRI